MATSPSTQSAVIKFDKSLTAARGLFDLYPSPRPVGAPGAQYRAIPPAVVQSVTAGFEAFAEELIVIVMVRQGDTWAQIAANADMTNPSLRILAQKLEHVAGIRVSPGGRWTLKVWKQSGAKKTAWSRSASRTWEDLLYDADGWMQVRHCLTHGLVVGTSPAIWPGPVTKKALNNQAGMASASAVLAESGAKRSLGLYSSVNAGLVYAHGAAQIASAVAVALGDDVDTTSLTEKFDTV